MNKFTLFVSKKSELHLLLDDEDLAIVRALQKEEGWVASHTYLAALAKEQADLHGWELDTWRAEYDDTQIY